MKKIAMTKNAYNALAFKATTILAALLLVLLPATGFGSFAQVANANGLSTDTSLSTFTIDGQTVTDASSVNVEYGTDAVDVVAIPTAVSDGAEVAVTGDTDLVTGPNTVTVVVTAEDVSVTQTYNVTVNVTENDDVTLGVFSINGDDVVSGGSVELPFGTTEVDYIAEASDVEASVVVDVVDELATGPNTLTVTVTAANGTSSATYTVTLNVLENSDATLGVFSINGNDVANGESVELPYGTSEVDYVAEATDPEANVVVAVADELATGPNTLTVTVTAANGTSSATYTVTLNVLRNNDASLGVFSVNGTDVVNGETVELANGVTSVAVVAEPTDPNAQAVITGATGLVTGPNELKVVVTAENGVATTTHIVTLNVAGSQFSNDTSLSTFKVDGKNAVDNSSFNILLGRTSVVVEAVPTNQYATAVIAGNTKLVDGPNNLTVTVTADDGTVKIYRVTVTVAPPSSVKTISTISVNGTSYTSDFNAGTSFEAPYGTTQVSVAVVPTSSVASVLVTKNTGLIVGENTINIKVTAEDESVANYSFKVVVAAANTNTALSVFKVNGTDVLTGSSLDLPFGTSAVSVEAGTEAGTSTFVVSGNSGLVAGPNSLTVTVTAQSGAQQVFTRTLNVLAASSNKTISSVTVNGLAVVDGAVTLGRGVTSATVTATLASAFASYRVSGASSLNPGVNTVTVTVTAQDSSTAETEITVTVSQPSSVKTLESITVDTAPVGVGRTVNKPNGTTSVAVVATATSNVSTAVVTGDKNLVTGANVVTVTVTAEDGTSAAYTFTVLVAKSSVKTLASITANGETVVDGGSINLSAGTTSVNVVAIATSGEATVSVSGDTALKAGANTVTVTVTAGDLTTKDYTFTANVLSLSVDTSLAVFTINGQNALTNSTINVATEVTEALVVAQTTSSAATYQVTSGTELATPGTYTITLVVTAENTAFTQTYNVTVIRAVALSNNANLGSIKIGQTDVFVESNYDVPFGTTSVDVVATAEDEGATTSVSGTTGLKSGTNVVTVFVTAANSRVVTYKFNVVVAKSNNADLTALRVNGTSVSLNDLTFQVPATTTSVVVSATTADVDASFQVTGQNVLVTGDNEVVITVTAANLTTTREYKLNVIRAALSSNTALGVVTLNGVEVEAGANVEFPNGTTEVFVTATTEDPDSTPVVSGTTSLKTGANTITIVVTAPSSAKQTYTLTATVRALSSDTTLAVFTLDGNVVNDKDVINLDGTKNYVEVVAQATDFSSTVDVSGSTNLAFGSNQVKVTVTAEDKSIKIYTLYVNFPDLTDASLATFTINGTTVVDTQTIELAAGVTDVAVVALANSVGANVDIDGGAGLEPGENTVTVTVTAADGETIKVYTVTLKVALSSDTSLSEFTVNGKAVLDDETIEVPAGTESVEVVAVPTFETAGVDIVGGDALEPGENIIEVTVTAANSDTKVYRITVVLLLSTQTGVSEILVGGESVLDGDVVLSTDLELTEIDVEVTTIDENAEFIVEGNTDLVPGDNEITITVTAPKGNTRVYKVIFRLGGLPGNAKLDSLNVGGSDLDLTAESLSVSLRAGSKSVAVIAVAQDQSAAVSVSGNKALSAGANTVTITVTGADGSTVRTYTVTVNVPALSNNSQLIGVRVNGVSGSYSPVVTLRAGSGSVELIGIPVQSSATVSYTGLTNLVAGENNATIKVTAEDGTFTNYPVTLVVPALSSDKSLSSFKIQGFSVLGKTKLTVAKGTTKLLVSAIANGTGASVTIAGRDIQPGSNDVVVTVTAADGTSQTYTVKVKA